MYCGFAQQSWSRTSSGVEFLQIFKSLEIVANCFKFRNSSLRIFWSTVRIFRSILDFLQLRRVTEQIFRTAQIFQLTYFDEIFRDLCSSPVFVHMPSHHTPSPFSPRLASSALQVLGTMVNCFGAHAGPVSLSRCFNRSQLLRFTNPTAS